VEIRRVSVKEKRGNSTGFLLSGIFLFIFLETFGIVGSFVGKNLGKSFKRSNVKQREFFHVSLSLGSFEEIEEG
jgi:uncharacterized membrane protein YeaQ/YmgE (transglycosylase-associated protein family)